MNKIKKPDVIKQYGVLKKLIEEHETYIANLIDAEIEAEYAGDVDKKKELLYVEANYQELVNLLYDVVGFIESKGFE